MRFLVDECLSPALVHEAQRCGHEGYHLVHLGKAGSADRDIMALALARDMVLVTNNASDFRRLYATLDLHPGLVVVIPNAERSTQIRLFRAVLSCIAAVPDLVNKGLEVDLDDDRTILVEYELSRRT